MGKGNLIGKSNIPAIYEAKGIWDLQEQSNGRLDDEWPRQGVIKDGLVLHLDAGDTASYPGSGTTWTDLSGYGHNGTLVNGPTFSGAGGGAIVFDGSNDYVNVTETADLRPRKLSVELVFEVLSDTNTVAGGAPSTIQYIYFRKNVNAGGFEGYLGNYNESTDSIDTTCAQPSLGGTQYGIGTGSNTVPLNTRKHAVYLFDTNEMSIYLNGVLAAGPSYKDDDINYDLTRTLKIGGTNESWNASFNGRIFQFRIYNRILSSTEISYNFNAIREKFGI